MPNAFSGMGQEGKHTVRQSCCKPVLEELKVHLLLNMKEKHVKFLAEE